MLENIKLILGLNKTDYDNLIDLFISKVTKRVEGYCNIEDINELAENEQDALLEFIEDKVCNIIANKLSKDGENINTSTTVAQGQVQSITRGSVSITYASGSSSVDTTTKTSAELAMDEKEYLNQFRRCRFY